MLEPDVSMKAAGGRVQSTTAWSLAHCGFYINVTKDGHGKKGTPPPTRGVMGGNQGMNSHMSEILSWALEPLADALLPKSSEVISNEDLKSNIDSVNKRNGNWIPDQKLEGNLRDVQSMMEAEMEMPGWCQCEECLMSEEECEGDMKALMSGRRARSHPLYLGWAGNVCP